MDSNFANGRTSVRSFSFFKLVLLGFLIATLVRIFWVQIYQVGGESMAPTLQPTDRVLVNKMFEGVQRGDLVVIDGNGTFIFSVEDSYSQQILALLGFESLDGKLFVKRIVAVGGDELRCCSEAGNLILNGAELIEPYLAQSASSDTFNVSVPEGYFWVMGDNRENSRDSRDLLGLPGGGMIPDTKIIGKVQAIIWPPARIRSLNK